MKKVRLDDEEIKAIKESIKAYDKDAKIFIFGSRAEYPLAWTNIPFKVIYPHLRFGDPKTNLCKLRNFMFKYF
ncbi:MAG: hypothetical protein ACP5UF_07780, partial [Hydrogenobaculum sp.]